MQATEMETEAQWLQRQVNRLRDHRRLDHLMTLQGAEKFLPKALSRPEPDEDGNVRELCEWEFELLRVRIANHAPG